MKLKYFSYSAIQVFMKCPAQFKYKYIDRIKKKDESIEAFMGKLVHKTLEYLHNQRLAESMVSYDNLITYYSSMWDKHWHNRVVVYLVSLP